MFKKKARIFRNYPLCGKKGNLFFYFYNPIAYAFRFFFFRETKEIPKQKDLKILLCCEAALGDVLLASSLIPTLKSAFPFGQIGFLCKSSAAVVLEKEKRLDFIHFASQGKKKELIREIQNKRYDVSLELHPFFRSSLPLMRKAKIACRLGFDSAGYDVWMTDPVSFPQKIEYLPNLYTALLEKFGLNASFLRPEVFFDPSSKTLPKEYLVLHLGTSNPLKEWDVKKWREVATHLKDKGFTLIFTGQGKREKKLIEQAFEGLGEDLCDQLSWNDFVAVIAGAKAVISVDSVSVHLAALFQIPLVSLYLYNHVVELWLPDAEKAFFLIGRDCIRKNTENHPKATYLSEIKVSDVIEHVQKLILT